MDQFKRGSCSQRFGQILVQDELSNVGSSKLRMSRSKSPEATKSLDHHQASSERGSHRRSYYYKSPRQFYYSSTVEAQKIQMDTRGKSKFSLPRSNKRSRSPHDSHSTEPRQLINNMQNLSLGKSRSNPGSVSDRVEILDDYPPSPEYVGAISPPLMPIEIESQKKIADPELRTPSRVDSYSSISDGSVFSSGGYLDDLDGNMSDIDISDPQLLNSQKRVSRRRSHWWRVRARFRVLRALNQSISEEVLETDPPAAAESSISNKPASIKTVTEETPVTSIEEDAGNITTEQTPSFIIETPAGENVNISSDETNKSFTFDELVKNSPAYRRSMVGGSGLLAPPTEDGRTLSINSERSFSSAATSEYSSECSLCATPSNDIEYTNDKKGVWSLYIDNILTGVVEKIMDELSDVIRQDGGIRNHTNNTTSGTSASRSASNQSSSTITPGAYQGHSSGLGKRSYSHSNGGSPDDGDEGQFPNKQAKLDGQQSIAYLSPNLIRRLACPFYKRFPTEFASHSTCSSSGWDTVHRVKGHLYRCHRSPIRCDRCFEKFKDDEELKNHNRSEPRCTVMHEQPHEPGFDRKQEVLLRSRKGLKGKDEAARWTQIYMILFPEVGLQIPDPYIRVTAKDDENKNLEEYLKRHVKDQVREKLQESVENLDDVVPEQAQAILEIIHNMVPGVVRDVLHNCFEQFKELQHIPGNSAQDQGRPVIPPDMSHPTPSAAECSPDLNTQIRRASYVHDPGSEISNHLRSNESTLDSYTPITPITPNDSGTSYSAPASRASSIYLHSNNSGYIPQGEAVKNPVASSPEAMHPPFDGFSFVYGNAQPLPLPLPLSLPQSHIPGVLSESAPMQMPSAIVTAIQSQPNIVTSDEYSPLISPLHPATSQAFTAPQTVTMEDLALRGLPLEEASLGEVSLGEMPLRDMTVDAQAFYNHNPWQPEQHQQQYF